ncbi:hypothetical protein B7H19_09495 [Pseudomonas putida]|uniref:hypothetical protein n=1 Tax=Pseudomonas putida TaxID=303 RepID=UPI000A101F48|nr:hypothetical protein [Pseudomonas putida]ORL69715.1 hypothetical protein B7H19_09495 [Pseudomonas putida]
MNRIDWSKAPEWADGHGLVAHHGITEVWISMDQYAVVGAEDRAYPYGGGTGDNRHNFTRSQIQYITSRPENWKGDGIPPVGARCECAQLYGKWAEGEVVAHHWEGAIVAIGDSEKGFEYDSYQANQIRPIRTPEQIAADERLHKVRNAHTAIAKTLESFSGDIPAEAVSRQVIEAMIDAGYSKQVTP